MRRLHSRRRGRLRSLAAVLAALAFPAIAFAQSASPPPARPPSGDAIAGFTIEAARRFDIPAAWIDALIRVESASDPRAVSAAGALGLMQVMPTTWAGERERYGLGRDPFDPHDNIIAGTAFLRAMRDRYGVGGMLAAYNAGPGRYEDYRLRGRPLPPETVAYVAQLAPMMGDGAATIPGAQPLPDPLAWARAALFSARGLNAPAARTDGAGDAANPPPSGQPSNDTGAVPVATIEPPSTGLFIPPSGQRTP